jgi:hypothetical protein
VGRHFDHLSGPEARSRFDPRNPKVMTGLVDGIRDKKLSDKINNQNIQGGWIRV